MIFLCPVEHRFQYIFPAHFTLTRHIIPTGRSIRDPAVVKHPVKIPGSRALEPGIQRVCMIIYYIHDHTKSPGMQRLDHLFHLPDTHLSSCRISRIRPLRHIVVHRVISPVKLRILSGLIHRAVVIGRHDLHMCDPQILQIVQPRRMHAVIIQRRIPARKCLIFSPVSLRESSGYIPGEFFYVEFINDLLLLLLRCPVCLPALRVCPAQVHRHTSPAVDAAGFRIRIRRADGLPLHRNGKIIVDPVQALFCLPAPHAPVFPLHGDLLIRAPPAPFLKQIQGDTVSRRTPQLKRSPVDRTAHPKIIPVIYVIVPESRARIILFPL